MKTIMEKNYSTDLAHAIQNYLDERGWSYKFDEEKGFIKFRLSIHSKINIVDYRIQVRKDSYCVNAVANIGADRSDPSVMMRVSEFLHRANCWIALGNFEMDFRDGEILYKFGVSCSGSLPSKEIIDDSFLIPARMWRKFGNGIASVLFTDISAEDAYKSCV